MLVAARVLPASLIVALFPAAGRPRRARDDHLLERQHRRAEGRDALAPQRPRQHRRRQRAVPARRPTTSCSACCRSFTPSATPSRSGCRWSSASRAVYHPNPTDAKTIGEMAAKYGATLLVSTPTFCSAYARKMPARTVRQAAAGDRRRRAAARTDRVGVQGEVRRRSDRGLRLHRDGAGGGGQRAATPTGSGSRAGTVGQPLPGISAKIVDPDTGEGPLVGKEGLLLVTGPNQMRGYLGEPDLTARGAARRLVRDRRHRHDRRGRFHPHHRSAVALQQDRRRDGAAHEGRGAAAGAAARSAHLRRDRGARRGQG